MKRLALSTAIILGVAAPAFANDQLAASLGIEPGVYSTAELIDLRTAYENNDQSRIGFILSGASDGVAVSSAAAGHIQLANSLGVDPTGFSHAELLALRAAEESDDRSTASFIRNGGNADVTVSSRSMSGNAALAASLGVDAGSFTTEQLIDLRIAMEGEDHARVAFILSQAR